MRANLSKVKLIEPRFSYGYDYVSNPDGEPTTFDNSKHIDHYQFGDKITHWASAPGIGKWVYEVIQVDQEGIWGILLEDTVRELTAEEVM